MGTDLCPSQSDPGLTDVAMAFSEAGRPLLGKTLVDEPRSAEAGQKEFLVLQFNRCRLDV